MDHNWCKPRSEGLSRRCAAAFDLLGLFTPEVQSFFLIDPISALMIILHASAACGSASDYTEPWYSQFPECVPVMVCPGGDDAGSNVSHRSGTVLDNALK